MPPKCTAPKKLDTIWGHFSLERKLDITKNTTLTTSYSPKKTRPEKPISHPGNASR